MGMLGAVNSNEVTLRERSSVLAGWAHGVFNSQKVGLWALLFPTVNPLLGGYAGLVGIAVWLALRLWVVRRNREVPSGVTSLAPALLQR